MRVVRFACATLVAAVVAFGASPAAAQDTPQALRQEIDSAAPRFRAAPAAYGIVSRLSRKSCRPWRAGPSRRQERQRHPRRCRLRLNQAPQQRRRPHQLRQPRRCHRVRRGRRADRRVARVRRRGQRVEGVQPGHRGHRRFSRLAAGVNHSAPPPSLEMHESEASFQAVKVIACAVIDLPDPDSPTSASVAPGAMAKETRSSARTFMPRMSNSIDRSRTSTRFVL